MFHNSEYKKVEINIKRITSSGHMLLYKNNLEVLHTILYDSDPFLEKNKALEKDSNIGILDIETYVDKNNPSIPYCVPYAIGAKTKFKKIKHYYSPGIDPEIMVLNFINELMVKENHNCVFFGHAASGFDSVLILKFLLESAKYHDLVIKAIPNKRGQIIELTIIKKLPQNKIIKITIIDSYLFFPYPLEDLSVTFKCSENKGLFPYDFMCIDTLNYKGVIPDISFYKDIDYKQYKNLKLDIDINYNGV
jgi:hypothetical protein